MEWTKKLIISSWVFFCICFHISLAKETIRASGQLFCGTLPTVGVHVRLYDAFEQNDMPLGESYTRSGGYFDVFGRREEIISPLLIIYHRCNGMKTGLDKVTMKIPFEYIQKAGDELSLERVFNIGRIDLRTAFPDAIRIAMIPYYDRPYKQQLY